MPKKPKFDPEKHCGNPDRRRAHLVMLSRIETHTKILGKLEEGSDKHANKAKLLETLKSVAAGYERDVAPCQKPKGEGTNHYGKGLCKWHCDCKGEENGHGFSLRLGTYQLIQDEGALREIGKLVVSGVDPMDLEGDLIVMRGMIAQFLRSRQSLNFSSADISDAAKLLELVGKTVERINTLKLKSAVSWDAVTIMMQRMGDVVKNVVTNPDDLNRILDGWSAISPVDPDARLRLVE